MHEDYKNKPLLTVKDVQDILCLSRTSVYKFLQNDPPFKIIKINKSIRIPSNHFFEWLDE